MTGHPHLSLATCRHWLGLPDNTPPGQVFRAALMAAIEARDLAFEAEPSLRLTTDVPPELLRQLDQFVEGQN